MDGSNLNTLSDEKLVSLLKTGNHLAFVQIYKRHWERLYQNSVNILRDKGLAEDVLHDVFTDIWLRRDRLEIRNLNSYLFRAVRNNTLLKLRNEKFISIYRDDIAKLTLQPKVELQYAKRELEFSIGFALRKLPNKCRTIFIMSRYQGYSISEIATHFNISHRTVENQLHRALKHLRVTLRVTLLLLFS